MDLQAMLIVAAAAVLLISVGSFGGVRSRLVAGSHHARACGLYEETTQW
jgi:hypothetical protein